MASDASEVATLQSAAATATTTQSAEAAAILLEAALTDFDAYWVDCDGGLDFSDLF